MTCGQYVLSDAIQTESYLSLLLSFSYISSPFFTINIREAQCDLSGKETCSELVTSIRNWVLPGGSKPTNLCGSLNQVLFACPGH